jgi:hypothetical protein
MAETRGEVRGGFGDDMDFACAAIYAHFRGLPGWQGRSLDDFEVVYLAGFFAFIALASSPKARFHLSESAVGARASVARSLMLHGTPAEALNPRIKAFQVRLNEYARLWVGVLKGENTFGAFATHAFDTVQAGTRTRYGYADHLDTFARFCDQRIHAFHSAVPVPLVERR